MTASYLDAAILRLATAEARRLMAEQSLDAEEAARRATPGAWAPYRARVLAALGDPGAADDSA